jgi:NAD(P)-dependent dehydrogenase (short-subunit alcohol dehydrogenase family)
MNTNVYGAWRMTQAFLPLLKNCQQGRIVNVSSGAGALDSQTGGTPAYSMSKVALNSLMLMLANQLSGITWAATLPDEGPTGGFFRDAKMIEF